MMVRLSFTAGSLAGRTFDIPNPGSLSIGRSRTCDVKVTEPDVSGRHLVFRCGVKDCATVEIASARTTLFNGTPVSMGDSFSVKDGDTFRCGSLLSCHVECIADNATVPPPTTLKGVQSESAKTVTPSDLVGGQDSISTDPPPHATPPKQDASPSKVSAGEGGVDNTIAIQTRIASDEELEDIRRAHRVRQTRRTMAIIVPAILFLIAAIAAWMLFKPKTEEYVSWPEDSQGRSMDRNVLVSPYLAMTVPNSTSCRVEKRENNVEVWTFAGIRHDVPMHFQAVSSSSTNELMIGRDRSFDGWLKAQRIADVSFNPSTDRQRMWVCRQSGNGILVNYVTYTRRIGEDDYYGYLLYLRFEDATHAIFAEVLLKDRWRSDPLLHGNLSSFVWFAAKRVPVAWEGHDVIRVGCSPENDIDEAERYFSPDGRLAAAYWDAVWYRVRSALVKAKLSGDDVMLSRSRTLLLRLRTAQTDLYAELRNAWNQADRCEDIRTKQTVQISGEAAFSEDFRNYDYRYDSIRRKEWK